MKCGAQRAVARPPPSIVNLHTGANPLGGVEGTVEWWSTADECRATAQGGRATKQRGRKHCDYFSATPQPMAAFVDRISGRWVGTFLPRHQGHVD